ncbi:hypothetical protein SCP_1301550 [Sparassis crispa]|uniref:CxC2-like cysteine cluster KDZ transposase-associated domain-containing protein n=1 Tax=Sparassis crispa TaxID=139825 RepID=A0A401H1V2_9APHY|nr:hypothetical protein SCP_1301550 [Sparassis crispa]GBE88340.1 hypothetical protein SCP_1301550 [Sparassis crispa]
MRMMREWRHLKMLKHAGRGHDPGGAASTLPGSCVVLCPACPHPGKNLHADWAIAPKDKSWLYRLFLCIDANFCLKRKKVSSDKVDPGLNHGYTYFVEEKSYKDHLHMYDKVFPDNISTCNNHDALKLASMKGAHQGTAASGVGTVDCARHDMKHPYSVGDLQKGERYMNMTTYSGLQSVSTVNMEQMILSYRTTSSVSGQKTSGIALNTTACHLDSSTTILHLLFPSSIFSHIKNHAESPALSTSSRGSLGLIVKESSENTHHTIYDAFGDYNWRKICNTARTFLAKVKTVVQEHCEHIAVFQDFDSVMMAESSAEGWKDMIEAWEIDSMAPNPFVVTRPTITLAGARLQLAEEEAANINEGWGVMVHEEVSASMMINNGLDLEEWQQRLRVDVAALSQHATELQCTKIQERHNVLQHRIEKWYGVQRLYMPGVDVLRTRTAASRETPFMAHDMPLLLPFTVQGQMACDSALMDVEWRLRYALANDILNNLRRHLQLRSHMFIYKDRFVRGQQENTRARTTIQSVEDTVNADTTHYCTTFTALVALAVPLAKSGWQAELHPLNPADVRGMTEVFLRRAKVPGLCPGSGWLQEQAIAW